MTFDNPKFKPRPIYIRAIAESNNKQATAEFRKELNPTSEQILIEQYSAIINELVNTTITCVVSHFQYNLKKDKLIEKYAEELLNDLNATRIYYDGLDVAELPKFEVVIRLTKRLERHWNTYLRPFFFTNNLLFYYKKYQKGNNYMAMRVTYETASNWYRYKYDKVKTVCVPDEKNVKIQFVIYKEDKNFIAYSVKEVLSNKQVWNKDLSKQVYF